MWTSRPQEPVQLQVPTQQDVSRHTAKQQPTALLTHCSASAYLCFFGIAEENLALKEAFRQEAAMFQEDFGVKQESNWLLKVRISEIPKTCCCRVGAVRTKEPTSQRTCTSPALARCVGGELHKPLQSGREIPMLWLTGRLWDRIY
ncbi:uncharacterized protein LJ206_012237 isoform 1-T1 [Theristicus caerulescens]